MSGFVTETGNPANPGEQLVDVGAGRVSLSDRLGNSLIVTDATNPDLQQGLPMMGTNWLTARLVRVLPGGGLSTGQVCVWDDPVIGTAVDVNKWTNSVATHTITQTAGVMVFNASNTLTITTGAQQTTVQKFAVPASGRAIWRRRASLDAHQSGHIFETGFGNPATSTTPSPGDGAFIRKTAAGQWQGVVASGSVEFPVNLIADSALVAAIIVATNYITFEVELAADVATFRMLEHDGSVLAEKSLSCGGNGTLPSFQVSRFSAFDREWNQTALGTAVRVRLGASSVNYADQGLAVSPGMLAMLQNRAGLNQPFGAFASIVNYTKDTAPVVRTLSGTAAGEATLGGKISVAAAVGAETDLIMFGFQNTSNHKLMIEGVDIPPPMIKGAAIATAATEIEYGLGFNNTAVSLVTVGTRYLSLAGSHLAAIAAPIGAAFTGPTVSFNCNEGYPVEPGRFFHIIQRQVSGAATASCAYRYNVMVRGRFV